MLAHFHVLHAHGLQAASEAEILIRQEQRAFEGWRDSLETVPTIKALRSKVRGYLVSRLSTLLVLACTRCAEVHCLHEGK